MANGDCVLGAKNTADIAALQRETDRLADVDAEQWAAINQIRNRLPVWATVAISLLTFLCGILGTVAIKGG